MILRAHGSSSFSFCGVQTKIFARDGVWPGPVGLSGPSTVRRSTEGSPMMSNPSMVVRRNGLIRSSFSA